MGGLRSEVSLRLSPGYTGPVTTSNIMVIEHTPGFIVEVFIGQTSKDE